MQSVAQSSLVVPLAALTLIVVTSASSTGAEPDWTERLQYRLFLLEDTSLSSDAALESTKQQLQRAAITDYNGAVLAASASWRAPQDLIHML